MNPFSEIKKNAKKIFSQRRVNSLIRKAVIKHKQTIIDTINQDQLFNQGIRGDGVELASFLPYSPVTIEEKKKLNLPTDRVTLSHTGKKYSKFKIKPISGGFEFFSSVEYFDDLEKDYGIDISKMTEENTEWFVRTYVLPIINEENKRLLG